MKKPLLLGIVPHFSLAVLLTIIIAHYPQENTACLVKTRYIYRSAVHSDDDTTPSPPSSVFTLGVRRIWKRRTRSTTTPITPTLPNDEPDDEDTAAAGWPMLVTNGDDEGYSEIQLISEQPPVNGVRKEETLKPATFRRRTTTTTTTTTTNITIAPTSTAIITTTTEPLLTLESEDDYNEPPAVVVRTSTNAAPTTTEKIDANNNSDEYYDDEETTTTTTTTTAATTTTTTTTEISKIIYNGRYRCGMIPRFANSIDVRLAKALPNEIPWQARLVIDMPSGSRRTCGGALIGNNNTVITAANCFDGVTRLSSIDVILGANSRNPADQEPGERHFGVVKIFKHHHSNLDLKTFDIAIVKIEAARLSDAIIPACLPESCRQPSKIESCYTSGWKTAMNNSIHADAGAPKLLKAASRLFKRSSRCSEITKTRGGRDDYEKAKLLCAKIANPQRNGYCHADLGGPLVCRGGDSISEGRFAIEGILSLHTSCVYGSVDVYFRICQFADWIRERLNYNFATFPGDLDEATLG